MPRCARNLDARLASGEFQIVERPQACRAASSPPPRPSRPNRKSSAGCARGRTRSSRFFRVQQAIAVADQHPHLNRAQKSVVEDVLSSPDRIQGIQGFAGAGKTTTLSVIRSAAESQGYRVEGFAPTSRAARQLERGRHRGRNPARLPCPHCKPRRSMSRSISTLSMNRALPAPTRCASSLRGLAPTTACS